MGYHALFPRSLDLRIGGKIISIKALISACLLGKKVRYDGGSNPVQALIDMDIDWIPVCPEVMGGLPIPRPPSERIGDRVVSVQGQDVTDAFELGVEKALQFLDDVDISFAVLKSRSPSCGSGWIYDGSFSSHLISGDGLLAQELKKRGLTLFTDEDLDELYDYIKLLKNL